MNLNHQEQKGNVVEYLSCTVISDIPVRINAGKV